MWKRDLAFAAIIVAVIALTTRYVLGPPDRDPIQAADPDDSISSVVADVDAAFAEDWAAKDLSVAGLADPLAICRRISLAMTGTIPSLEELRQLESLPPDKIVVSYVDRLLRDRRHADYLAERLARVYVGVDDGPFIVYRRRRFVSSRCACSRRAHSTRVACSWLR